MLPSIVFLQLSILRPPWKNNWQASEPLPPSSERVKKDIPPRRFARHSSSSRRSRSLQTGAVEPIQLGKPLWTGTFILTQKTISPVSDQTQQKEMRVSPSGVVYVENNTCAIDVARSRWMASSLARLRCRRKKLVFRQKMINSHRNSFKNGYIAPLEDRASTELDPYP